MKKFYSLLVTMLFLTSVGYSQFFFEVEINQVFEPEEVVFPPSPLKNQVLFIGNHDKVQTTPTYGHKAGQALAKQWHDFIGFTPDTESDDLGWVSVNHEMKEVNDSIGDGGGMTVFKVKRNPRTDELEIVEQTLDDGRTGKFFNVDFVNTVGETGMNCGGIVSPDGRIWTAEEWWVSNNEGIVDRDRSDFTIGTGTADGQTVTPVVTPLFDGETIEKYQNKNWMVEIDPKQAVALRKQYNWGRQAYEGGAVMPDNKTVYLSEDFTPGLFSKFVADAENDFTAGKLYVYKHDAADPVLGNWVEMDNGNLTEMLNYRDSAFARGATMFNRLEWSVEIDGKVYMTETARDGVGSRFYDWAQIGGVLSPHIISSVIDRFPGLAEKPESEIIDMVINGDFNDYYGRILVYDPATDEVTTYLDGGPFYEESPDVASYPEYHLSNPDGLSKLIVDGKSFMVIAEDLNGSSNGRVPAGLSNRDCELFLLDMSNTSPAISDLIRIAIVPKGAEVTGPVATPDGKTLLVNSQHPSTNNPFPFNNSLTFAITGWDFAVSAISDLEEIDFEADQLKMYPNPVSRELRFNKIVDAALYNQEGKRMRVYRGVDRIFVDDLSKGLYIIKTSQGSAKKLIIN